MVFTQKNDLGTVAQMDLPLSRTFDTHFFLGFEGGYISVIVVLGLWVVNTDNYLTPLICAIALDSILSHTQAITQQSTEY